MGYLYLRAESLILFGVSIVLCIYANYKDTKVRDAFKQYLDGLKLQLEEDKLIEGQLDLMQDLNT